MIVAEDLESPQQLIEREIRRYPSEVANYPKMEVHDDAISTINRCSATKVKKLCIFDVGHKLKLNSEFEIGGTYLGDEPELWFFYTTSICPGYNFLLNLFVCHRKTGPFTIAISNYSELIHLKTSVNTMGVTSLPNTLSYYSFTSAKPNEIYFIRSYCFSERDVKELEKNIFFIPIKIDMDPPHILNTDVIKRIKLKHDFGELLSKQEKTDFSLVSMSKKTFPTHKIILAAHSPVLRTLIKNTTSSSAFIDISDNDLELLLQFIYTGTIKDIMKQDCLKLLEIADKFQLKNLFLLNQFIIGKQIEIDNAVDIAVISEKYNLEKLQMNVFNFIKKNPKVLETDGWKNLNDVTLAKKLFQHIYMTKD